MAYACAGAPRKAYPFVASNSDSTNARDSCTIPPHRAATTETTTFSTLSHKDGVVCTPTMRSRYTAPGSGSGGSLSGSRSRIRRMPAAARTALEFSREIVGPSLSGIHIGGVDRAMGWYCHHIEPTDVGRLFQCKPFAPG